MELSLSEDQIILRDSLRRFAERHLSVPLSHIEEKPAHLARLRRAAEEMGLWGLTATFEAGGSELDVLTAALVVEELATFDPGFAALMAIHLGCFAPGASLVDGTETAGLAFLSPHSEPQAKTAAGFRLQGTLQIIAPADEYRNLFLIAPATEPGFFLLPLSQIPEFTSETRVGLDGLRFSTVDVDLVAASEQALEAPADRDLVAATTTLLGALAIGVGVRAAEEGLSYAADRQQFGKSLDRFQAIQFKLADMAAKIESARWLVIRAASTNDANLSRLAMLAASEAAFFTADEALQIHGGYGYTSEYPVESLYRHACELRRLGDLWTQVQTP